MSYIFIPPVEKKPKIEFLLPKQYFIRKRESRPTKFYASDPELFSEELNQLKYWCTPDPRIPDDITNPQLLQFYYASESNVYDAFGLILNHYAFIKMMPELFDKRNPSTNRKIARAWSIVRVATSPILTPNGCRVIYTGLVPESEQKYNMILHVKLFIMCVEASLLLEGINKNGYSIVIDTREFAIEFSVMAHQHIVLRYLPYFMEGIQVNIATVHLIFYPGYSDRVAYLRNYFSPEMNQKLYFHTCGTGEMLKLYEIIPRKCLPKELNGFLQDDLFVLSNRMRGMVESLSLYFVSEECQRAALVPVNDEEIHKKAEDIVESAMLDDSIKNKFDKIIKDNKIKMKEYHSFTQRKRSRNLFKFMVVHLNEMKNKTRSKEVVKFKPLNGLPPNWAKQEYIRMCKYIYGKLEKDCELNRISHTE